MVRADFDGVSTQFRWSCAKKKKKKKKECMRGLATSPKISPFSPPGATDGAGADHDVYWYDTRENGTGQSIDVSRNKNEKH